MASEREKALELAISRIEKQFGEGSVMKLGEMSARMMVEAIFMRDLPVVQACVLIVALAVVLANLATDLLYAYLDPRIRYQ